MTTSEQKIARRVAALVRFMESFRILTIALAIVLLIREVVR
jgi:hypothetical protein